MMNNAVDTVLEVLQDLKQNNETEASLFPNFGSVNLNVSEQVLENNVKQILQSSCNADIDNIQSDNMIYARNSVTGDIGFIQNGNAQANCVMTNAASANLNLQQEGDQNNTIAGVGFGSIIGLIILAIVILVVVGAVGRASKKAEKSAAK